MLIKLAESRPGDDCGVFVLRTYALWNCDRRVRIALLVSYLGFFCGMTILVVASGLQSNIANFAPGCYTKIVGLTLYRMIRHYRATRCRLLTLLAQYSVGYILAGLLFTIGDYGPMLEGSQIVAQGLLATRMQLDLWRLNRHSPAVAPASYSTEYDQTDLEFELSQRASTIPSGTVQ
ncbi:hypothetical protein F4604DRAFT_1801893 [Suillus subluteus]|nr:hypothetical protein F4604DRAFT_1801893 [Suillus subluteus]